MSRENMICGDAWRIEMSENEVELRSELQELENIEENDGADDESIADDLYTISSHGVDQTAEVLIGKINKVFSPGIWWIGFRMNRSGSDVQVLQMYS